LGLVDLQGCIAVAQRVTLGEDEQAQDALGRWPTTGAVLQVEP